MASQSQWKDAGLFQEYWKVTWDPAKGDPDAWATVKDYIDDIETRVRSGSGLVLLGPPGTGKTLFAHRIGRAAIDKKISVQCTTIAAYQEALNRLPSYQAVARHHEDGAVKVWRTLEWLDEVKEAKLLILDDLGKEHTTMSGFIENQCDHLIRERGNRRLATIITTQRRAGRLGGSLRAVHGLVHPSGVRPRLRRWRRQASRHDSS